jgi:hypothetical protein
MLSNIKPKKALTSPGAAQLERFVDTDRLSARILRLKRVVSVKRTKVAVNSVPIIGTRRFAKNVDPWYHRGFSTHLFIFSDGQHDWCESTLV